MWTFRIPENATNNTQLRLVIIIVATKSGILPSLALAMSPLHTQISFALQRLSVCELLTREYLCVYDSASSKLYCRLFALCICIYSHNMSLICNSYVNDVDSVLRASVAASRIAYSPMYVCVWVCECIVVCSYSVISLIKKFQTRLAYLDVVCVAVRPWPPSLSFAIASSSRRATDQPMCVV